MMQVGYHVDVKKLQRCMVIWENSSYLCIELEGFPKLLLSSPQQTIRAPYPEEEELFNYLKQHHKVVTISASVARQTTGYLKESK